MKTLETCDLFEAGASRDAIHFATSHGGRLYTIQDAQRLRIWQLDDALTPTLIATVALEQEHYEPQFLFVGERLVLWEDNVISIVDLAANRATFGKHMDKICACGAAPDGTLWVQHDDGYGRWEPPGEPAVVVPVERRYGAFATEVDGRIYWSHQDGIDQLDVRGEPKLVSTTRHDTVRAFPQLVGTRLANLEIYDDARTSVAIVDLAGKKPKLVGRFFKNYTVRAWAVEGTKLHVIVRNSKKLGGKREFENVRAIIEVDGEPAIVEQTTLPYVEVYAEGRTCVRWLGLTGSTMAILLGDGMLHRFAR